MIYRTINDIKQAYLKGVTTPEELISNILIESKKLDLNNGSIVRLNVEYAMQAVQNLSKDKSLPLWGIPCLIKDNILVEGLEVTAQSRILTGHMAAYTSDVAQSLIDNGAVIIGYTNMDEFAFGSSTEYSGFNNLTKNAFDSQRVAGGTSGGSAVAVALSIVPFALGTDTGGSVRQPASFNGVYGLRPTYGAISRYGVIASASSFDQVGPLANCIEDVELVFNVLRGKKIKDQTSVDLNTNKSFNGSTEVKNSNLAFDNLANSSNPNINISTSSLGDLNTAKSFKLKIGICKEFVENLEDHVESKFKELINTLKTDYELIDISLPSTKSILPVYYILQTVEAASNLERFDQIRYGSSSSINNKDDLYFAPRGEEFGEEVKRRIMLGTYTSSAGYYDAYYNQACKVRKIIQDEYQAAFNTIDVLLMPACPFPAWKIGEKSLDPMAMYTADIMTVSQPIAKLPAFCIPLSKDLELPVGLQLVGAEGADMELLKIARLIDKTQIQ